MYYNTPQNLTTMSSPIATTETEIENMTPSEINTSSPIESRSKKVYRVHYVVGSDARPIEPNKFAGRYCAKIPRTAASKAMGALIKKNPTMQDATEITLILRETGKKMRSFKVYTGARVLLKEPVAVTHGDKEVTYRHENKLARVYGQNAKQIVENNVILHQNVVQLEAEMQAESEAEKKVDAPKEKVKSPKKAAAAPKKTATVAEPVAVAVTESVAVPVEPTVVEAVVAEVVAAPKKAKSVAKKQVKK